MRRTIPTRFRLPKMVSGAIFPKPSNVPFVVTLAFASLVVSSVFRVTVSAQEQTQPSGPNREATKTNGAIEGLVLFYGAIPQSPIADDAGVRRELLEADRATRGLRYVVAHLTFVNVSSNQQPALAMKRPAAKSPVVVDQQDHAFVPRVLAVREGEPVIFTNSDAANHNVRAASTNPRNEFNVFTGTDGKYEHRFVSDSQHRPIRLGCDIHPWMQAWIYVFDDSLFAVTDDQGRFRIGSVPPGEYKLVLQQPDIRYTHEQRVTISNQEPAMVKIEIRAGNLSQPKE